MTTIQRRHHHHHALDRLRMIARLRWCSIRRGGPSKLTDNNVPPPHTRYVAMLYSTPTAAETKKNPDSSLHHPAVCIIDYMSLDCRDRGCLSLLATLHIRYQPHHAQQFCNNFGSAQSTIEPPLLIQHPSSHFAGIIITTMAID